MDRIKKLYSFLDPCNVFADVACDHGYFAEYMLKNGLCREAIISDISEKSLSKAQSLLADYISEGRCKAVCCDGLEKIDRIADEVMIAGIGGEEIVKILKNAYIPQRFVFQPMKNAETLREFLLEKNCALSSDDLFSDGKNYYFVLKGRLKDKASNDVRYTKAQMLYGKDSLKNPVFFEYLNEELAKKKGYLSRDMTPLSRKDIEEKINFMEGVLKGEIE